MGQTMEKTIMSTDAIIFFLQHLGFMLNLEKSILNSVQEIEFLRVTIKPLILALCLYYRRKYIRTHPQWAGVTRFLDSWPALKIWIDVSDIYYESS